MSIPSPALVLAPVALVPDEPEDEAIDVIAQLAGALGARVELIHVRAVPGTLHPERLTPRFDDRALREPRAALARLSEVVEGRGVSAGTSIVFGVPHLRIAELAGTLRALFVALRRGGSNRLGSLGHVTDRVLRTSSAPVLSLPRAFGRPISKIAVGDDFSASAERALTEAGRLAGALGGPLEVVHALAAEADAEASQVVTEALARRAAAHPSASHRCARGEPAEVLLGADADLIALGATGKNRVERVLLGATSVAVLRRAATPVLLVP